MPAVSAPEYKEPSRSPVPFQVRRFVALDLHGHKGSVMRRRLVLTEFAIAAATGTVAGLVAATASAPATVIFGCCLVGIGVNYAALVVWELVRRKALGDEPVGQERSRAVERPPGNVWLPAAHFEQEQRYVVVDLARTLLQASQQIRQHVIEGGCRYLR